MALKAGRHRLFDFLCGKEVMRAQGDLVVLAQEQAQNIDVILARLGAIDQEPRPGTLAQRIVDILGEVGKHPKGAIAAHDGARPGKGLHEDRRHLLLARAGLAVAALAGHLVNVVDGAKADDRGVDHRVDKGLGVLA